MNKPTIFLIDEDENSRPALRTFLKEKDFHVSIAIDEEDALDRVSHECLKADLLVMSVVGKSPEQILEIGRNICRVGDLDVPIVIIAQNFGDDLEGKDIKAGEKDYVTYLEDSDQLFSLLSFLTPIASDE